MQKYALIILSLALIATGVYALKSETLSERVERENRETLIRCLDEASKKSTTQEILQAKNACQESILTKIIIPTDTDTGSGKVINTGTVAPAISGVPKQGITPTIALNATKESIKKVQSPTKSAPSVKKKEQLQSLEKNSSFWTTYDLAIPLIQKYEGLHLKAYWDHAGYSIGWGTRAKHAKEVITQAEADKRLGFIVKQVITRVQRDFPTLSSKQQAGLVSFAFNCHNGYKDVVERGLDKHKYWCRTASGVKLQGLVNRRLEEQTLIFN